jgi:anti-sigma factor RsiW
MSDIRDDLTAYIDGELPPGRAREVEAALAADPSLRALEQRLRRAIGAVEALPAPEGAASPALRRNVLAAIDEPAWWQRWFTLPRLAPVGLALAAVAVAVVVWPQAQVDEGAPADEEKLLLAQNLDVVEDLDLVGLSSAEDLDVVAELHELEVTP